MDSVDGPLILSLASQDTLECPHFKSFNIFRFKINLLVL